MVTLMVDALMGLSFVGAFGALASVLYTRDFMVGTIENDEDLA